VNSCLFHITVADQSLAANEHGKPHMCEELYREGGTTVYVCTRHPNGLTTEEYRKLLQKTPEAAKWSWQARLVIRLSTCVVEFGIPTMPPFDWTAGTGSK
jgi:hypothetical protein